MLTTQVALVPFERAGAELTPLHREMMLVASALQTQLSRDFGPTWAVSAVVTPFLDLGDVPPQYLPVIVTGDALPRGHHGFHLAADGRPFALIHRDADWSVTASHELMELVLDPSGLLTISAPSLADEYAEKKQPLPRHKHQGMVDYLVEPCDPVEYGRRYTIDGVSVSDFVTPHYYDSYGATGRRYSFLGTVTHPLQILDGGYLSWRTRGPRNSVWQAFASAPAANPGDATGTAGSSSGPEPKISGTPADHLKISRLKDGDPDDSDGATAAKDDFASRFTRDHVAARTGKGRGAGTPAAAAALALGDRPTRDQLRASWERYGDDFRKDVDQMIKYLKEPPPPTLRDIINLLEESRRTKTKSNDDLLDAYKIPKKGKKTQGKSDDLRTVIKLLKQQEAIANILDSNASDPDLASWLCRLMP